MTGALLANAGLSWSMLARSTNQPPLNVLRDLVWLSELRQAVVNRSTLSSEGHWDERRIPQ